MSLYIEIVIQIYRYKTFQKIRDLKCRGKYMHESKKYLICQIEVIEQ